MKQKENSCYVVGAGTFYGHVIAPKPGDLLIAADGGYTYLQKHHIPADWVIGDFDSLRVPPDHPHVVPLPKEKDDTDMLAALRMGLEAGYRVFRLYGGTGGRMDHTLANLQCLAFLSRRGAQGFLYGPDYIATAITNGTMTFGPEHKGYVSVFALSDPAAGVYLKGLKYPLTDATVTPDFPLGVSNEFTGVPSSITVKNGTLLILYL